MEQEPRFTRPSSLFNCESCNGIGVPQKVATKSSASVVIALTCLTCGHEWHVTRIISKRGVVTYGKNGDLL